MQKKYIYLILLAAFLFGVSFPPLPTGFAAYFGLVPLIFALKGKKESQAFLLGYIYGLVSAILVIWWVAEVTFPGMLGACIILGIYTGILSFIFAFISKKNHTLAVLSLPFLWVFMEYIRSISEFNFPWLNLAYTQTYYLPLVQYASILGSFGVSFWVVLINIVIYFIIYKFSAKRLIIGIIALIILIGVPLFYGIREMREDLEGDEIKIALLQGNVDPYRKWDKEFKQMNKKIYFDLLDQLDYDGLDLIVLPETATASYISRDRRFLSVLHQIADSLDIPIITGSLDYKKKEPKDYIYYNAAALVTPGERDLKFFYKTRLVPFSEHIPFEENVKCFQKFDFGQGNFTPGKDLTIFSIPEGDFCCIICYEVLFGDLVRKFVLKGADFVVNITNDGWFGITSGPYQHARTGVIRAIENRVSIARAANTGFSLFIDPYGRVIRSTKLNELGYIIDNIPLRTEKTFYTKHGDLIAFICLGYIPILLLISLFLKG
ncbi:MAG: apolipoprotein N-acyltransferase [Acidobacteria bacterium]|nr:apolipoprotein N-acyltransferase [Acidobacteriota bacterium]